MVPHLGLGTFLGQVLHREHFCLQVESFLLLHFCLTLSFNFCITNTKTASAVLHSTSSLLQSQSQNCHLLLRFL